MSTATLQPPAPAILPDRTYGTRELAQLLGVHVNTVTFWARTGVIPPGRRFGRKILRWTTGDIAPLLAERR
jgi:predicted site-specific integrase-resolvase